MDWQLDVRPSRQESAALRPGDDLVPDADIVMDRGFDLPVVPEWVWPWFAQLGKGRGGWYLPRWAEVLIPPSRRALRHLEPSLRDDLRPGDVIDDWGGLAATFEIITHDPLCTLVHRSKRGNLHISWAIVLSPVGSNATRVHLRFRMAGVRRHFLASVGGGILDLMTVAGLAAGLRERVGRETIRHRHRHRHRLPGLRR